MWVKSPSCGGKAQCGRRGGGLRQVSGSDRRCGLPGGRSAANALTACGADIFATWIDELAVARGQVSRRLIGNIRNQARASGSERLTLSAAHATRGSREAPLAVGWALGESKGR